MGFSHIALLLVCVVVVAVADEPKPCCMPKQWVITIDAVNVNEENGNLTNTLSVIREAYDAENELVTRIQTTHDAKGQAEETKTISLYPQGTKYTIRNGVCTKEPIGHDFAELCVPAVATYYETVKIGLGGYEVDGFKLVIPGQGYNFELRFGVGREKCILYQYDAQKIKSGKAPTGPAKKSSLPWWLSDVQSVQLLSSTAQYYDYEEGIKDPSYWFKVPPECKQSDDDQKIGAKKMANKLRSLFDVDKTFSVY